MNEKQKYLAAISRRGDRYGNQGGIMDLLIWCDKMNTQAVTLTEARCFFEDPGAPYCPCKSEQNF